MYTHDALYVLANIHLKTNKIEHHMISFYLRDQDSVPDLTLYKSRDSALS